MPLGQACHQRLPLQVEIRRDPFLLLFEISGQQRHIRQPARWQVQDDMPAGHRQIRRGHQRECAPMEKDGQAKQDRQLLKRHHILCLVLLSCVLWESLPRMWRLFSS